MYRHWWMLWYCSWLWSYLHQHSWIIHLCLQLRISTCCWWKRMLVYSGLDICILRYLFLPTQVMIDIDECTGSNICHQVCTNTEGSFTCGCEAGYVLDSDGASCSGIIINYISPNLNVSFTSFLRWHHPHQWNGDLRPNLSKTRRNYGHSRM